MSLRSWFGAARRWLTALGSSGGWISLCDFDLRGAHLQMVELRIVGGRHEVDSVAIPAKAGRYVVEYQVIFYGNDRRVSRMRTYPTGLAVTLEAKLGAIDVDWGGVAITDVDVLVPSVDAHLGEYDRWFKNVVFGNDDKQVGVHHWKLSDTMIPYADGGFGDGTYCVYALNSNGRAVGLEVEFITPGEKYPF